VDDDTDDDTVQSICTTTADTVDCPYSTVGIDPGFGFLSRDVHVATPNGTPPQGGWPAVLFFQGSLFSAELSFTGERGAPFGQFELARTVKSLLDAGYVVIAPDAFGNGSTFWQTTSPPFSVVWSGSGDDRMMQELFAEIDDDGLFGPVNEAALYATGISSGGFMTSRMAVSYPGRFRALAIHSGGYATCSALCLMPSSLPSDHPPTLFVHGMTDAIVPPRVMVQYKDALDADGVTTLLISSETEGHEWMAGAVDGLPEWFASH
jgi:predicted esterase